MRLSKPSRFVAALIALISMLFMQLAVAGYVCPGQSFPQAHTAAVMPMDTDAHNMSDCGSMDMEQPNLCQAYAHADYQSLDKPPSPAVAPFIAGALTLVFQDLELTHPPRPIQQDWLLLTRTTAPPLSIRHCCFRI